MISTALPPASARSARALAMLPEPMMLMLLMVCLLPGAGQDVTPTPAEFWNGPSRSYAVMDERVKKAIT
jgi:hypothetical protein